MRVLLIIVINKWQELKWKMKKKTNRIQQSSSPSIYLTHASMGKPSEHGWRAFGYGNHDKFPCAHNTSHTSYTRMFCSCLPACRYNRFLRPFHLPLVRTYNLVAFVTVVGQCVRVSACVCVSTAQNRTFYWFNGIECASLSLAPCVLFSSSFAYISAARFQFLQFYFFFGSLFS